MQHRFQKHNCSCAHSTIGALHIRCTIAANTVLAQYSPIPLFEKFFLHFEWFQIFRFIYPWIQPNIGTISFWCNSCNIILSRIHKYFMSVEQVQGKGELSGSLVHILKLFSHISSVGKSESNNVKVTKRPPCSLLLFKSIKTVEPFFIKYEQTRWK